MEKNNLSQMRSTHLVFIEHEMCVQASLSKRSYIAKLLLCKRLDISAPIQSQSQWSEFRIHEQHTQNSIPMGDTALPGVFLFNPCAVILFCVWVSSLVYPQNVWQRLSRRLDSPAFLGLSIRIRCSAHSSSGISTPFHR